MRLCKVDTKTIEKLKEIQNMILLINVRKDALDKKSKKQALKLLEELLQQKN